MFMMESVDDLWDLIAYVQGYAPDRFPYRDLLADNDRMTLDRAFEQLHAGVVIAYPEQDFEARRHDLHRVLDRAFLAYRDGDEVEGVTALSEFEDRIFER